MRSVNKVILIGYLAADPDFTTTTGGKSVTNFKIATNRDWKSTDGEKHQDTDYHRIVAWKKLAEISAQYLKKGAAVYLEGRLMNHQYTDKNGIERQMTEIVADTINFMNFRRTKNVEDITLVEVAE